MKRNGIILIAALVIFLVAGQSMSAGIAFTAQSPQASDGNIDGSSAIQVDIYIDNESSGDWCGGNFAFGFSSPDGSITEITHIDVAGDDDYPSVEYINGFATMMNMFIFPAAEGIDMDGSLPDKIAWGVAGMGCMPASAANMAYIRFNIQIDYSTTGTTGQFCLDSINLAESGGGEDWDWIFLEEYSPVTFNGPYCWTITNLTHTDVELIQDTDVLPTDFGLEQNYPNPFNPNTTFDFALPRQSAVQIDIFNVLGQKIKTLADGEYEAGHYSVNWDGTDDIGSSAATGIYFYRMNAGDFQDTKKLMLLK